MVDGGWQQLSVRFKGADLEQVEASLYAIGALALTLKDAADQPLLEPGPGELPLWDDVTIDALFDESAHPELLMTALQQLLAHVNIDKIHTTFIKNQAWERAWMERFKPMAFGKRLWIYPTHIPPSNDATVNVLLDPGLAFGTGTHPTTALCLSWLDQADVLGKTVIDYGCGSGVLAIAACKLGAVRAYACDIDPQALTATHSNAKLNGVSEKIMVLSIDELAQVQADIMLANILSNILVQLSDTLATHTKPAGQLVLSGILTDQAEHVTAAYETQFEINAAQQKEEWLLITGQKKSCVY